ncbi:hypothetical protein [Limnospira platensis]|uniref:hypothetical protein n=1 Tax=Limnospira platensis TaxID=118562 RepID=UPI000F808F1A|nr:hypothetical protein [Arthrospira platensis NCB002]QQW29709.1 hypothetical protein AP9108_02145 [Arthrospira sp. PCC 9108]
MVILPGKVGLRVSVYSDCTSETDFWAKSLWGCRNSGRSLVRVSDMASVTLGDRSQLCRLGETQ